MANWNEGSKDRQKPGCLAVVILFVTFALLVRPVSALSNEFTSTQVEFLSGKAVGESSSDPYSVACVMRNRLEGGWAPAKVSDHFYAKWVPPTSEQAEKLALILNGDGDCNQDAWYQFSNADVLNLHPRQDCFLFESGGNQYYAKCAFWR